jgi:integrase/recombinase XerD
MTKDLKQLFLEYKDYCTYTSRLRPATIKGYSEAFKHFENLVPEVKIPDHLTTDKMSEFFKMLQTRTRVVGKGEKRVGVKDSTVRTYWSKLNSFFEWLLTKNYIEINPLSSIKPPEPDYNDRRALTGKEVHKILSAITLHSNAVLILKRDMLLVHILLFCGLRKGEVLGLEVRDIDIANRKITIRSETTKSRKMREIPINQTLLIHLIDYLSERKKYKTEKLVVSRNGDRGLSEGGLIHWVRKYKKLSGVNFHLHKFRHTFACNLGTQNVSAIKVQKLMGHTDLRMTQRYLRSMTVDDLRDGINKLTVDTLV